MSDFRALLESLVQSEVEFIIIGGVAAVLHGSARLTQDLDLVDVTLIRENLWRIVRALQDHAPYLRGAPPGLPFKLDEPTLRMGLNFTLVTKLGDIDLLGEIPGGGSYADLRSHTIEVAPYGLRCLCIDLPTLIRVKRAAGRPKDLEAIGELEKILEERERSGQV